MSCCKIHYNQKILRLLCNMHNCESNIKNTQPWKCVAHTQKQDKCGYSKKNVKYLMSLSKEYIRLSNGFNINSNWVWKLQTLLICMIKGNGLNFLKSSFQSNLFLCCWFAFLFKGIWFDFEFESVFAHSSEHHHVQSHLNNPFSLWTGKQWRHQYPLYWVLI